LGGKARKTSLFFGLLIGGVSRNDGGSWKILILIGNFNVKNI
jgi:hypothetical protein